MIDNPEDEAWDELERKQTKNKIKQNMNERIKELAEQAGVMFNTLGATYPCNSLSETLERFAELVRQDEREAIEREQAGALPPTDNAIYWMDMVVGNLVRNGVNKHRARELANHFYTYTTPTENNNG